ncbi:hypothetical protein [Aquimarina rubra]|uniref:Uncharacterized protein n=1 Tax=Aquimarina rubra TaxID=1920033 RepID=A0ABW5LL50_9FLAO
MKTLFKITIFNIFLSLFFISCSKDDSASIPEDPNSGELIETPGQISEDDFESFEGELGFVIDARPLARKGYKPTQVIINVEADNGNFTETVPVDKYTLMGQLKIPLESLSEAAKTELASGVRITPEYQDATGTTIFTEPTFIQSFRPNPSPRIANTGMLEETEENQTLSFRSGTSYYIQRMNADGSPDTGSFTTTSNSDLDDVISASSNAAFNGNEPNRSFTFDSVPNKPNTFLIRHTESGRFIRYATITATAPNNSASFFGMKLTPNTSLTQIENASDYHNYQFTFEKQDNGTYIIKNTVGDALKQAPAFGLSFDDTINNTANGGSTVTAEARRWRIVTASVNWSVASIGTTILPPVLPKPETAFEFNSVLTNCGSGTLSQTVDSRVTENVSRTVGWEETLSMSTANSFSVTAGVDVEFSAELFGVGTNVTASLETTYQHDWSSTETNSNWESSSLDDTVALYSSRTVTVPPGNGSLVYDVQQFYPETKVNFVQRLRIEATDNQGLLSGQAIRTLFYLTNFTGVITEVEDTSIVVTLKGTMVLDKIVDFESNVQDVPANCN